MENKKIWNLILNTNVRANDDIDGTCAYPMTVSYVYTGFDAAKRDFLRVIDKYAHSDNGLFDGKGGIPELKRYIDSLELDDEEDDVDAL